MAQKGSIFRGGATVIGLGNGVTSISTSGTDVTFSADEPLTIERLVIGEAAENAVVTSLRVRGDLLVSGAVPAAMFRADSVHNPRLGWSIHSKDSVKLTVRSTSGTISAPIGFEASPAPFDPGQEGSSYRAGRTLIALGATAEKTNFLNGSHTFDIEPEEPGVLGRLVLQTSGDIDDLEVTSLRIANDELVAGSGLAAEMFTADSRANPLLGHPFDSATKIRVTVKNHNTGKVGDIVSCGFTVL